MNADKEDFSTTTPKRRSPNKEFFAKYPKLEKRIPTKEESAKEEFVDIIARRVIHKLLWVFGPLID